MAVKCGLSIAGSAGNNRCFLPHAYGRHIACATDTIRGFALARDGVIAYILCQGDPNARSSEVTRHSIFLPAERQQDRQLARVDTPRGAEGRKFSLEGGTHSCPTRLKQPKAASIAARSKPSSKRVTSRISSGSWLIACLRPAYGSEHVADRKYHATSGTLPSPRGRHTVGGPSGSWKNTGKGPSLRQLPTSWNPLGPALRPISCVRSSRCARR